MAALEKLIAPDWAEALAECADTITELGQFLRSENSQARPFAPSGDLILRAFTKPMRDVKVLILGQDPYPTPGHAVGLSFSVNRDVRPLPASLRNIYKELSTDLGIEPASHGDLSSWFDQGVFLLNKVLTVRLRAAGSHRGKGWEHVSETAIKALAGRGGPLVAILWGKDARSAEALLPNVATISSPHPSPLSAHTGFFGSRPFSQANDALAAQGATPIQWQLD